METVKQIAAEVTQVTSLHSAGPSISQILDSPLGPVTIENPTSSATLKALGIDPGLTAFRPAWRQKEALEEIADLEDGWVVTAYHNGTIVGYITFHPPGEFERWGRAGIREIVELGAIEVAPGFRNIKLGKKMMQAAFADSITDHYIILSTEYYWHWDTEGTGLNVWEYQQVMKKLMESVGMSQMATDEQEICAHPANMLMVRIGPKVAPEAAAGFENLLFRKKKG